MWQPLDFLAKLAALVPPPRAHLVTYHGVLAPAAAMRAAIVPAARSDGSKRRSCAAGGAARTRAYGRLPWAELLKRVFLGTCCAALVAGGGAGRP